MESYHVTVYWRSISGNECCKTAVVKSKSGAVAIETIRDRIQNYKKFWSIVHCSAMPVSTPTEA